MIDTVDSGKKKSIAGLRRGARKLALQSLYQWEMAGQSLLEIETQFRLHSNMAKVDGDYYSELLHKVPQNLTVIDEAFESLLDRKKESLDKVELALLRLSTYELMFRIDVPYKVVINEGVALAKSFGATDSHKYINGILDLVALNTRKVEKNAQR